MRILILIQLLAGFVLAFLGVIVMFHLHVWSGLLVTLCGMYGVLRAVHREEKKSTHKVISGSVYEINPDGTEEEK